MNFAQLATTPIPAWITCVLVIAWALLELARLQVASNKPDHHAELLDVTRGLIKSHSDSVSAIAELAKQREAADA